MAGASLLAATKLGLLRAASIVVVLGTLFFSYATFEPALRTLLAALQLPRGAAALYGFFLVFVGLLTWIGSRRPATARFILGGAIALLFSTFVFAVASFALARDANEKQTSGALSWPTGRAKPNIYHFVFDGMGRPDQIKASLGLNLDEVVPMYVALGFVPAPHATTIYLTTETSIGALLNPDRTPDGQLDIAGSDVVKALRASGYDYNFYGEVFYFAACSGTEDRCLAVNARGLSEFDITMLRRTPAYAVFKRRILAATSSRELRQNLLSIARTRNVGPTYTLSYMTPPHPPFIFSKGCVADQKDFNDFRAWRTASIPRYGIAYRCVAAASTQAISLIVRKDPTAIIIVSGDHGPMFRAPHGVRTSDWPPAALAERRAAFLAVRAPERCKDSIAAITQLSQVYPTLSQCLGETR